MIRALIITSLCGPAVVFAFTAALGITGSWVVALPIAVVAVGLVFVYARKRLPLDDSSVPRSLKTISALFTVLALVQLIRVSVFMADSSRVGYSFVPGSQWEVQHSCLSAYFVADRASQATGNIYDISLYSMPDDDPAQPRKAQMVGPFKVDVYEYPPPFLLLPRLVRLLTPDFQPMRLLWFGIMGAVMLLGFVVVARRIGPEAGTRALMLAPLVWVSLPMVSTMQKGNVQPLVIAAAMLAMVLFERGRRIAGGVILAFVCVSKLFPGLLAVYLIARRDWRALAWTAAAAAAFVVLSVADIGWPAFAAFREHLPGLLSGEAFPAFRNPPAMAHNMSIPGLVFKAKLLGVSGMSFDEAKIVGSVYSIVAVVVTWIASRRVIRHERAPLAWLAILILATLRSPFLPQAYGTIPALWLLTLLVALRPATSRAMIKMVLVWIGLNLYWPADWVGDPRPDVVLFLIPQTLMVVVVVWALRRDSQLTLENRRSAAGKPLAV